MVLKRLHIIGMAALLLGLYAVGVVPGIDRALNDLRYLLMPRDATGQVVIVQIDSNSLKQLGEWPWSRSLHAKAINNLAAAGVSRIGVDIDFSSPSSGDADKDLITAVSNSPARIVLPVFKQWSSTRGGEVTTTMPMRDLAEFTLLGSVNVSPATDGLVREYDRLHTWHESFVPSFATELIGRTTAGTRSFYLDYSIRPETIPRVSFVDLLRNDVDASLLKDKYVIIGATALELGDEIAVPTYGALSGPELQAIAAESILLNRAITKTDTYVVLGIALLIGVVFSGLFVRMPYVRGTIIYVTAGVTIVTAGMFAQSFFPIDAPVGATLITTGYCFIYGLTRQIDTQALLVFKRSAEIRERRALTQAIADNSLTGIVVADHMGKVRFVNKAATEILNVPQKELLERDVAKVILPDDGDVSFDEPTRGPAKIYTTLKISGDTSLPVEIVVSNISIKPENGRFERRTFARQFTVYAITDISVYKQTEEVLSRAAEQAIEANRSKSEFIANMSHELRTPLNAILGFSETIKSEIYGPIGSEKYRSYAEDIFTSGAHLLAIINDLLEVSRLAAGKTQVHADVVDIKDTVNECMRIATGYPGAGLLDLTSHVDEDVETIWTDGRIVKQIILNLLSNAIKFTPENGKVTLSACLTDDGSTEIVVEDNGIGIPADQIERVMEPFHQVEGALRRNYHGSGLGLHLVKSQVSLLEAIMRIESQIRKGTRISIRFPAGSTVKAGKVVQIDRSILKQSAN